MVFSLRDSFFSADQIISDRRILRIFSSIEDHLYRFALSIAASFHSIYIMRITAVFSLHRKRFSKVAFLSFCSRNSIESYFAIGLYLPFL
jgi:hypothetical protein